MTMDFGKQVGPLPLGAWIVAGAAGIGIAWYTRRGNSSEVVTDTSGVPGVGDGSVGGWVPNFPSTGSTNPMPAPDPRDKVTDNDAWYTYVFTELVGRGYDSTLTDSALRKYLAGLSSKLSVSEWVVIRMALTIMPPPSPIPASPDDPNPPKPPVLTEPPKSVPPPTTTPKPPAPKPPVSKPAVRYYTVKKGDSLWNIARKYYGNGAQYVRIYNANLKGKKRVDGTIGMISNPNQIQAGWKLVIP